jgi:transposase
MNPDNLPQTNENPLPSDNTACDTEERTLSLLQKIQAGVMDPKCIRPAERRLIVSYLMADGYSTADMAQILKVSDRSIERDKKAVREANAIAADPQLVEQMVGRLVLEAELSIQRIRKAVRDKDTPQAVRIEAEHRCYQIVSDMITSLQRLGYLPSQPKEIVGTFYNRSNTDEDNSPETMRKMLLGIEEATRDMGLLDKDVTARIEVLKARIVQSEISVEIKKLEENTLKVQEKNDEEGH